MVYAMHQIQVACLVHHALEIPWHREFMKRISSEQLLLASATSEAGIGGNTRTSSCAVIRDGEKFSLKKNAIVISYGAHANAILVTARTTPESAPSDQVLVVVEKKDYSLDQTGGWDTLGMRGTESTGHVLTATGNVAQIIAHPYADISSCTMLPVAHLTWSALWLGIASDAVSRARAFVRAEARKNPGNTPPGALRVAEVMSELQMMRANLADMALDYADKIGSPDQLTALSFAVKMNHLKVGSSEMAVKIVNLALRVCGISGFRNDTPYSLGPSPARRAQLAADGVERPHSRQHRFSAARPQRGFRAVTIELHEFRKQLFEHRLLIPMGVDGLYGRGEVFEDIGTAFDKAVTREGGGDGAEVIRFPPAITRAMFETSGYLASFPNLAGTIHSFFGGDKDHLALMRMVDAKEDWTVGQKATQAVTVPAACYPIYPTLSARGPLPKDGALVDVYSWCFRHEPSLEPTRQIYFRMREYVRIGSPDQVTAFREQWIERGQRLMTSLQLPLNVDVANDPFFGRAGKMLVTNQRDQNLKFELLVPVIDGIGATACLSFNYHQDKFGNAFGLKQADGSTAHSACVGFGIERVVLALIATHGYQPKEWPAAVRGVLWP